MILKTDKNIVRCEYEINRWSSSDSTLHTYLSSGARLGPFPRAFSRFGKVDLSTFHWALFLTKSYFSTKVPANQTLWPSALQALSEIFSKSLETTLLLAWAERTRTANWSFFAAKFCVSAGNRLPMRIRSMLIEVTWLMNMLCACAHKLWKNSCACMQNVNKQTTCCRSSNEVARW